MNPFLITVKLPKNPDHDPRNKVTGPCPVDMTRGRICTDVTGEHHTVLVAAPDLEAARRTMLLLKPGIHITRIEEV